MLYTGLEECPGFHICAVISVVLVVHATPVCAPLHYLFLVDGALAAASADSKALFIPCILEPFAR